jgi:hypothetical protein
MSGGSCKMSRTFYFKKVYAKCLFETVCVDVRSMYSIAGCPRYNVPVFNGCEPPVFGTEEGPSEEIRRTNSRKFEYFRLFYGSLIFSQPPIFLSTRRMTHLCLRPVIPLAFVPVHNTVPVVTLYSVLERHYLTILRLFVTSSKL